jgi:hypothetical protein
MGLVHCQRDQRLRPSAGGSLGAFILTPVLGETVRASATTAASKDDRRIGRQDQPRRMEGAKTSFPARLVDRW